MPTLIRWRLLPAFLFALPCLGAGSPAGAATAAFRTHTGTAVVGENYTGQSGLLTWSAGDASAKTIPVSLIGGAFSGTRTFTVALYTTHGAAPWDFRRRTGVPPPPHR